MAGRKSPFKANRGKGFDSSKFINDSLKKIAAKVPRTSEDLVQIGQTMARRMEKAGNKELDNMFPWMADHLMGMVDSFVGQVYFLKIFHSNDDTTGAATSRIRLIQWKRPEAANYRKELDALNDSNITWHWLSQNYVKQKKSHKFWTNTGLLREQASGWNAQSKFGGVHVNFHYDYQNFIKYGFAPSTGTVTNRPKGAKRPTQDTFKLEGKTFNIEPVIGDMEFVVIPKVNPSQLPFLQSGDWRTFNPNHTLEDRFFSQSQARKLGGKPGRFRPMVQPLLGYWLQYRLPAAMERVVGRSLFARTRFKTGNVSYGTGQSSIGDLS